MIPIFTARCARDAEYAENCKCSFLLPVRGRQKKNPQPLRGGVKMCSQLP
jgi:hypothetical protein